jgi:5'(3')-deoxyribonucleotidase
MIDNKEEDNYNNYRDKLLKESNLKHGDLVEYISIDYDLNYTSILRGIFFYTIKGKPKVKSGKRVYNWCTQWKKVDSYY